MKNIKSNEKWKYQNFLATESIQRLQLELKIA